MLHVCVLTGAISIHKCYASHHMHKPHGSSGISEKHSQDRPSPVFFFFQAEDGIRDWSVTGVQTCLFRSQAEDCIRDWSATAAQTCAPPISTSFIAIFATAVLRCASVRAR